MAHHSKMLAFYKVKDSLVPRERLLTLAMIRWMSWEVSKRREKFITYLIRATFFFALRSYEYITILEFLRIKIITSNRISFFKQSHLGLESISFTDPSAISMQIIFAIQKNLNKNKLSTDDLMYTHLQQQFTKNINNSYK